MIVPIEKELSVVQVCPFQVEVCVHWGKQDGLCCRLVVLGQRPAAVLELLPFAWLQALQGLDLQL